jgi:hypothetical protein
LIILDDGVIGLFGRGLKTRILCNGLQGLLFSILWKLFLDLWVLQSLTVARVRANQKFPQVGPEDKFIVHRYGLHISPNKYGQEVAFSVSIVFLFSLLYWMISF